MQADYKSPWWRKFQGSDSDSQVNLLTGFVSLAGLMVLIWIMATSCVSGIVREVERQEEYEPRPRWASQTYSKPAAYRLATPEPHEMDQLHHIMALQEVRR